MLVSRSAHKRRRKPRKPSLTFPLTPHNNGQWCKKIRGKVHFFGVWEDPQAALQQYLKAAADLHAGRQPRRSTLARDGVLVKDVCNHYLTAQFRKAEVGEITPRWFEDCRRVVKSFSSSVGESRQAADLAPEDFQRYRHRLVRVGLIRTGAGLGVHALNRAITVIKGMFRYAYEVDLLDKPMKYGLCFAKASATQIRKSRQARDLANGKRLFTPAELKALISAAGAPLDAMILLGINGGFGNTDCAELPLPAVDFANSVLDFPRPKTAIERTVPLWPETHEALLHALAERPKPASEEYEKLFFLTVFGRAWVRERMHAKAVDSVEKVVYQDAVRQEFDKLLKGLGIKRRGIGFYALRHTFRTWADETKDHHAVMRIMGHAIPGMSGEYIEGISVDRLQAVVDYVRGKLLG